MINLNTENNYQSMQVIFIRKWSYHSTVKAAYYDPYLRFWRLVATTSGDDYYHNSKRRSQAKKYKERQVCISKSFSLKTTRNNIVMFLTEVA